jgi:hypothetical protein
MTLVERLADLKAKLSAAKTDDERKTISDEIDSISADATKVLDKLKTSNKEAEDSRKKAEALQKEIDGKTETPENPPENPPGDDKVPAWAKSLALSVETLNGTVTELKNKDQLVKKTELIKTSLKNAGIPESFIGSIHIEGEDQEAIDKAVTAFKQTLVDEKLLSSEGVKQGEKGNIQNESILNYAKERNQPGGGKAFITGKKLVKETE